MPKILTSEQFIQMPWKNGQGTTLELFRINASHSQDFELRISKATLSNDGPFSLFPELKRAISILSGNGVILNISDRESIHLNKESKIFIFQGHEKIDCHLKDGPCTDFNIFWNPLKYNVSFMHLPNIHNADISFYYQFKKETLTIFSKGEKTIEMGNHELDGLYFQVDYK